MSLSYLYITCIFHVEITAVVKGITYFLLQQLYSVHLAEHTEDCTVQLADHIKVLKLSAVVIMIITI